MPSQFGFGAMPSPRPQQSSLGPGAAGGSAAGAQPLIVSAAGTLSAGEGGVNTEALRNNFGIPFAVDEIRWSLQASGVLGSQSFIGGNVACRLGLAGQELTNGPVPVWSFGPGKHLDQEEESAQANLYRWRGSRPIVVMPGEVIEPSFSVKDALTTSTVNVRISYVGRLLPGLSRQWLPYATAYQSAIFDVGTSGADTSKEPDLRNKWDTDLEVERFTGRINMFDKNPSIRNYDHDQTALSSNPLTDVENALLTVKMFEGRGAAVIRTPTPFRAVFSGITRSWEVPHVMPPGSFYTVYLALTAAAAVSSTYAKFKADIGLVGWRRVG